MAAKTYIKKVLYERAEKLHATYCLLTAECFMMTLRLILVAFLVSSVKLQARHQVRKGPDAVLSSKFDQISDEIVYLYWSNNTNNFGNHPAPMTSVLLYPECCGTLATNSRAFHV